MFPRAVACDLDGTLLRSDGTLDDRSSRALADIERAGILLVLCTARPPRWMRSLAQATRQRGVAICANGAVLWDLRAESILEARPLAPEVARDVVALLKAALPAGAWAVERTSGFAHEPAYKPHWPVPEDSIIDAVEALIAEPGGQADASSRAFSGRRSAAARAGCRRSPCRADALKLGRQLAGDQRRWRQQGVSAITALRGARDRQHRCDRVWGHA